MLVAGEPSGDLLGAELVAAIAASAPGAGLRFFGAGGPRMAAAGVDLVEDLTQHSVVGFVEALRRYRTFKRIFDRLLGAAIDRRPEVIVCVDFAGFNVRFARAVRAYTRSRRLAPGWNPVIVQYVSPQVWASRPRRAEAIARHVDLLLALFPFEKDWYARRVPGLRVEFVGHPMLDRYATDPAGAVADAASRPAPDAILLLPGSRPGELRRHLPVMLDAVHRIRAARAGIPVALVLPGPELLPLVRKAAAGVTELEVQVGGLAERLRRARVAIASTGTVTLECAYFRVPTVAIYRTSRLTYEVGKRIVTVDHIAMPNLLAGERLFPELVQDAATGEHIAREALALLDDERRREHIKSRLDGVIASLGGPGASMRAASAILRQM